MAEGENVVTDKKFYLAKALRHKLNSFCYNIKQDKEYIAIVSGSGELGNGKSTLAQQMAYYCAWKLGVPFTLDNICFSSDEFKTAVRDLPQYSPIVYDESKLSFSSKDVLTKASKDMDKFFTQSRQFNRIIFLVIPDFFDLDKTLATNRSKILINVYFGKKQTKDKDGEDVIEETRGNYVVYSFKGKGRLWRKNAANKNRFYFYNDCIQFKNTFSINKAEPYMVDEEAYRNKKAEVINQLISEEEKGTSKWEDRCNTLLYILKEKLHVKFVDIERLLKENQCSFSKASIQRNFWKIQKAKKLEIHKSA